MDASPEIGTPSTTLPPEVREAAAAFAERHFPSAVLVILAGSVARGEGRSGSDLDLIIVADDTTSHWATFRESGWAIEVFAQTLDSYPDAFARDVSRRWPLVLTLCAEGIVLIDRAALAPRIQGEAKRLLDAGPPPLSDDEIGAYRYNLTWMTEDLLAFADIDEARLIAHDLAVTAAEYYLASHRQWLGRGKWLLRNLRRADVSVANNFTEALNALAQKGRTEPLVRFANARLAEMGGPCFEGRRETW